MGMHCSEAMDGVARTAAAPPAARKQQFRAGFDKGGKQRPCSQRKPALLLHVQFCLVFTQTEVLGLNLLA